MQDVYGEFNNEIKQRPKCVTIVKFISSICRYSLYRVGRYTMNHDDLMHSYVIQM